MSDFGLFKQEFDPEDEFGFDVVALTTEEMQDEWQDVASKVEKLWEARSEKQLLQLQREIKEQVQQWPG